MCSEPHSLLPPLVKGRGTAEGGGRVATLQGAISLQQKMGRIAPYTQRYSAPQRLHPPVTASPCQPPLARGAERFEQLRNKVQSVATFTRGGKRGCALLQPTATIPTKSSIHQPNVDASETERPCTTTVRVHGLTKAKYRTDASAHNQGVQGEPPGVFPRLFRKKPGPRRAGGPSGEDTGRALS